MRIRGALLVASSLLIAFHCPAFAASQLQLAQATPPPPQTTPQPAAPAPDAAAPAASDPPAQQTADPQQAAEEPVGNVAKLDGTATITRNGETAPLQAQDDIYMGDTLQTGAQSTLAVTFTDDTTLNLSANTQVVVDNFVYQQGGTSNAALISVARGTMAFVASAVAKTGDMSIATPTATLGIRGTTGLIEVPENMTSGRDVAIKLYPDADGRVGRIEVNGRDGTRLGLLSQGASGFSVRNMGARFMAVPMVMSAQQIARDRGFMQLTHSMQGMGRRIVTQRRNFRMQNPQRGNFGRPGLNRPGFNRPNLNRPGNQPGQFNRPGQPGQRNVPGLQNPRGGSPNAPGQGRQFGTSPTGPQRQGGFAPRQGTASPSGAPGLNRLGSVPPSAAPRRFGAPGVPNRFGAQRMPGPVPSMARPGLRGLPGAVRKPPVQLKKPQIPR